MAKNLVFDLGPDMPFGVTVTDPTSPSSGDAVRVGMMTGVAIADKGDGQDVSTETAVEFGIKIWDLPVKGEAGAITAWDPIFYDDGISGLNNDGTNGYFFGFALEAVGSGETDTIQVLHIPSPGAGSLADGVITAGKLANDCLSADATGRAKLQDDLFNAATVLAKFATDSFDAAELLKLIKNGAFAADTSTRALFADGIWTGAKLADDALSADATGRAKVADDFFNAATALAKFDADSMANAFLILAIADGAFQADAATRALFADKIWTAAKLADAILDGAKVAVVADANTTGGLPVLHRINIAGGAAGNTDVILDRKERVIDVWAVHTGGAGEGSDTIQVFNGASAITDAMSWAGADKALVRAAEIDDAAHEIALGGTLRVTTTDNDAGDDVGAGVVYVLAIPVA